MFIHALKYAHADLDQGNTARNLLFRSVIDTKKHPVVFLEKKNGMLAAEVHLYNIMRDVRKSLIFFVDLTNKVVPIFDLI